MGMEYQYLFYIIAGFFSGSVLFGYELPRLLRGVDVRKESEDGNPGTYNAFVCGGIGCGFLTLAAELAKGMWPVAACMRKLGCDSLLFAAVMAAPVLGHAFSVFHHGEGGKAIAVSFGVLLGVLPQWLPLALLVACFLFFSLVWRVEDHGKRTVRTFLCFALAGMVLIHQKALRLGSLILSLTVIHKHHLAALEAENNDRRLELE